MQRRPARHWNAHITPDASPHRAKKGHEYCYSLNKTQPLSFPSTSNAPHRFLFSVQYCYLLLLFFTPSITALLCIRFIKRRLFQSGERFFILWFSNVIPESMKGGAGGVTKPLPPLSQGGKGPSTFMTCSGFVRSEGPCYNLFYFKILQSRYVFMLL